MKKTLTIYNDNTYLIHDGNIEISYNDKGVKQIVDITNMNDGEIQNLISSIEKQNEN
jgi:hypothetical protein